MRILFFLALPAASLAFPSIPHQTKVIHEKRSSSSSWTPSPERPSPSLILPLKIGLVHNNIRRLPTVLDDISNPESLRYGRHYTTDRLASEFGASDDTILAVQEWLTEHGIEHGRIMLSPSRSWIHVNATVGEAERLLDTEYLVYEHPSGPKSIGCDSYSIPGILKERVDIITPTVHMNAMLKRSTLKGEPAASSFKRLGRLGSPLDANQPTSGCDQTVTLDCVRALYNYHYTPKVTDKNSYGILEFGLEVYNRSDLDVFFARFVPSLVGIIPQEFFVDGGISPNDTSVQTHVVESNFDLMIAMGLTVPQPITLIQVGDAVHGEDDVSFNDWLDAVDGSYCTFMGGDDPTLDPTYPDPAPGGFKGHTCGITTPPKVASISYAFDEWSLTPAYAERQCIEYAKLGALGTTVLYASGDVGVTGVSGFCLNDEGQPDANGTIYTNTFPSGCPFITSVGATQVNTGATTADPESSWDFTFEDERSSTGGGFSNYFRAPPYQTRAVRTYLEKYAPHGARFNRTGSRGFPDLSANGSNFTGVFKGRFVPASGTSASSPIVGAMITSINDARIAAGKSTVGFINPAIYSEFFADAFNDITSGESQGCTTEETGFRTSPGWDPVTGVGTPDFAKLLEKWLSLP